MSTIRYNKRVVIKNFEEIAQRAWGQTAGVTQDNMDKLMQIQAQLYVKINKII